MVFLPIEKKMRHIRKYRILIVLSILGIWTGYQCCIHVLSHVHVVNGTVYVHSHRASSDGGNKGVYHVHSFVQLILLQQLSQPVSEEGVLACKLSLFLVLMFVSLVQPIQRFALVAHALVNGLRAPPSC